MSELMTFLSNKKVVTNDMESATTTLAQRVGFEPTGDCSHDGFRVHAVMTSSVPLRILFCCTIVAFRGGFVNSLLCKIGAFLRIWRWNFGGNRVGGAGERLHRGRGYGKIKAVLDGSARYDCNY